MCACCLQPSNVEEMKLSSREHNNVQTTGGSHITRTCTVVWPPLASCLMALGSLMRPASACLPAPSASRSLGQQQQTAIVSIKLA
jgi:hypothetical protein